MVNVCAWLTLVSGALAQEYFLGRMGANCYDTCLALQMNCDPHIVTNDTADLFAQVGNMDNPPYPLFLMTKVLFHGISGACLSCRIPVHSRSHAMVG